MTLQQGWELGKAWYSHRMEPDWQRPSPQEAQAIFDAIGLAGDFWNLSV